MPNIRNEKRLEVAPGRKPRMSARAPAGERSGLVAAKRVWVWRFSVSWKRTIQTWKPLRGETKVLVLVGADMLR